MKEFAQHCHNTAKKREKDEEKGTERFVYVRLGPDHLAHAFCYESLARGKMARGAFNIY